jgi:ABC-type glycerol-3-phosphate transport system permease component
MVLTALKTHQQVFTEPMWRIPEHIQLGANIAQVFTLIPFWRYFSNSLIVATAITVGDLFFSTLAGFGLAKYRFPGRNLIFAVIVATMMIPFIVIMIPQTSSSGNLVDRHLCRADTLSDQQLRHLRWAPGIFAVFDDMIASARIDGAHDLRVLFQTVPPCADPRVAGNLRFLTRTPCCGRWWSRTARCARCRWAWRS